MTVTNLPSRPTWRALAACRGKPVSWWYPKSDHGHVSYKDGQGICATCPVQAECVTAGKGERYGMWGGRTPRQRPLIAQGTAGPAEVGQLGVLQKR